MFATLTQNGSGIQFPMQTRFKMVHIADGKRCLPDISIFSIASEEKCNNVEEGWIITKCGKNWLIKNKILPAIGEL